MQRNMIAFKCENPTPHPKTNHIKTTFRYIQGYNRTDSAKTRDDGSPQIGYVVKWLAAARGA
jgi:hypothetical protein